SWTTCSAPITASGSRVGAMPSRCRPKYRCNRSQSPISPPSPRWSSPNRSASQVSASSWPPPAPVALKSLEPYRKRWAAAWIIRRFRSLRSRPVGTTIWPPCSGSSGTAAMRWTSTRCTRHTRRSPGTACRTGWKNSGRTTRANSRCDLFHTCRNRDIDHIFSISRDEERRGRVQHVSNSGQAATDAHAPKQRTFFGHPMALANLGGVEMWERFSFYGMQGLLTYYLYFTATDGGLGLTEAAAATPVGAYGGLVWRSAILRPWGA